jgi:hypothetical protein
MMEELVAQKQRGLLLPACCVEEGGTGVAKANLSVAPRQIR